MNKIKVTFFDKQLLKQFGAVVSMFSVTLSLVVIFTDILEKSKPCLGYGFITLLIVSYIVMWLWANKLLHRKIRINNSIVEIKLGDIFGESGLKAIAFNEYFDTEVDEDGTVIASNSLNGMFIEQKVDSIGELNSLIKDSILEERIVDAQCIRKHGKTVKYKLGSIVLYKREYLLTAFSRFDDYNKAYLSMSDYLEFLLQFWSEVDRVYAGRSVIIPLFGSGLTRFHGYDSIDDQELLEILIWSFKISRVKLTYPAQLTIVIHPDKKERINFYNLKGGDFNVL